MSTNRCGQGLASGERVEVRGNVTTPRCPRIDIAREPFSLTLWHRILPAFRCQRLRAEGNAFDFAPARPTLRRSLTQPKHADGIRDQECLKGGQVSGLQPGYYLLWPGEADRGQRRRGQRLDATDLEQPGYCEADQIGKRSGIENAAGSEPVSSRSESARCAGSGCPPGRVGAAAESSRHPPNRRGCKRQGRRREVHRLCQPRLRLATSRDEGRLAGL